MAEPKKRTSDWIAKNVAKLGSAAMKAFGQDEWYKDDSKPTAPPIPKAPAAKAVRDREVDEAMQSFELSQTIMVGAGMDPVQFDSPQAEPPKMEVPDFTNVQVVSPQQDAKVSNEPKYVEPPSVVMDVKADLDRFDRRTSPKPPKPVRMKKTKAAKVPEDRPTNPRTPRPNKLATGQMPSQQRPKSAFSGFRDIDFQDPPQEWDNVEQSGQESKEITMDMAMEEVRSWIDQNTSAIETVSEQLVQATLRLRFVEEQIERLGSRS